MGLYPTVMVLTLLIYRAFPHAKLWQSLLVGNLLSSIAMTYVTMPFYVNRLLGRWLEADRRTSAPAVTLTGIGICSGTLAGWALLFWLLTGRG